jgi:CheY-like chemotaxis protein
MPSPEVKILHLEAANRKLVDLNRELLERSESLAERLGELEGTVLSMGFSNAELAGARDRAVRANETMQRFLANMSVEIRTPLTGMLGMIDFTLNSELKPDQASQLKIARKAGKALVKVINDVLEFSRFEAAAGPVAATSPRPAAAPAKSGTCRPGALSVLVAEDDLVIMEVMTLLICRAGHRVLKARDGLEVLGVWESERPDLILMDVQMPNLDGLEATRMIRERERDTGLAVPIYGITAHVLEQDIKSCLVAGMTGHLGKPIDFPDVLEILKRHQGPGSTTVAGPGDAGGKRHEQIEKAAT